MNRSALPNNLTRSLSRRTVFRRRVLHAQTDSEHAAAERTSKLQNRLEEQFIFEIFKDGGRGYKNLSVRALYGYVVKAVTANPESKLRQKTIISKRKELRYSYIQASAESFFKGPGKRNILASDTSESEGDGEDEEDQQPDSPEFTRRLEEIPEAPEAPEEAEEAEEAEVTYRERLGGFLHPRDIRKLFIPFSATTEPEIIVRRHVILLNFDTLRAIILRDRLLVFVPQGADSILDNLENRVRIGFPISTIKSKESDQVKGSSSDEIYDTDRDINDYFDREWDEMKRGEKGEGWIDLPFELRCIDAVLETVINTFMEDGNTLMDEAEHDMLDLLDTRSLNGSLVRQHKDKLIEISTRVQAFSRALNLVLDHNEDMALMNLSRLLSKPERFIQPVPEAVLNEESDEPELILEAHLQETNTLINELELTKSSVISTQEELNQRSDTVRNRLLYVEMIISIVSLNVALASLIGAYMGMNVTNHIETDADAFLQIVIGTSIAAFLLLAVLTTCLASSGVLPSMREL